MRGSKWRKPSLVVMAKAGIQQLHDQALVGAARSRVGIWLGLGDFSKPDDHTGTRSRESAILASFSQGR
jgi:hypothetical protein